MFLNSFHISFQTILLCTAITHLMIAAVMALFARHKVQYLSITWVMAIFGFMALSLIPFSNVIEHAQPGLLHPAMLLALMATAFLQSIYPLSIPMPGYLQWGRMLKYAMPACILIGVYVLALLFGVQPMKLHTWKEVITNCFTSDLLLRLAMLLLSLYYVVNIFRLPRIMLRMPDTPRYLTGYAVALGLSACIYVGVSIRFNIVFFEVWLSLFTLTNLYMFFRVLETLALGLPKPEMREVEEEPEVMEIAKTDQEDFNEANQQRFGRLEFWMQHHHDEWKSNDFGRDQLCEATGINRHLALQSLRSQGYNNVHDYINTYRIAELQRMIRYGEAKNLRECLDAGFGTVKTARNCFEKVTGETLDDFLMKYARKG